ncbi:MAG: DUF4149 domain-containing protein [Gallionella sp.]|nr:DUF4149 domain-containing protein [Gallionella sp.]
MMKNLYTSLSSIALTIWVGGLVAIGYIAVPILFSAQPDKQLAGKLAGEMFHALGYIGIVCGLIVLTHTQWLKEKGKQRSKGLWLVGTMLVLSLIIQFGISPQMAELKQLALPEDVMHSIYSDKFKTLHGVSSVMYLLQSLLGVYWVAYHHRRDIAEK